MDSFSTFVYIFFLYVTLTEGFKNNEHRLRSGVSKGNGPAIKIPCEEKIDCTMYGFDEELTCRDSVCMCDGIYCQLKEDDVKSKNKKNISKCRSDADCKIEHQTCLEGICICAKSFVESEDSRSCIKSEGNNAPTNCTKPEDCSQSNSNLFVCNNNVCSCTQGYQLNASGDCIPSISLGGDCSEDSNCTHATPFSRCSETKKCSCTERYVEYNSQCFLLANSIGSTCNHAIQCSQPLGDDAVCSSGYCKCKDLYRFDAVAKKCVRDSLIGQKCAAHEDCHQPGDESDGEGVHRMECSMGDCICRPPFKLVDGYCVNKATSLVPLFLIYLISLFVI